MVAGKLGCASATPLFCRESHGVDIEGCGGKDMERTGGILIFWDEVVGMSIWDEVVGMSIWDDREMTAYVRRGLYA